MTNNISTGIPRVCINLDESINQILSCKMPYVDRKPINWDHLNINEIKSISKFNADNYDLLEYDTSETDCNVLISQIQEVTFEDDFREIYENSPTICNNEARFYWLAWYKYFFS